MNEAEAILDRQSESTVYFDRSKRAFSISKESTRILETALKKERVSWRTKTIRFFSKLYSLYVLLFFFQAKPPKKGHILLYLFYATMISIQIVISIDFTFMLVTDSAQLWSVGIPYFFFYPGLTILSPIIGVFGVSPSS